jgi:hypothetical protein
VGLVHFLQISIGVVLLALLPLLLDSLHALREASWRISNAAVGAYHSFLLIWIIRRQDEAPSQIAPRLRPVLGSVAIGSILLNAWIASGGWPAAGAFGLLFGLIWMLAMALVNFVFILMGTIRHRSE